MPVSGQAEATVRAWLLGNDQEAVSLTTQMTDSDMQAYDALLQALLSLAAGRRFASGYTDADVIRYVARVRAGTDVRAEDLELDPKATETVLRHALGQPTIPDADSQTRIRAVLALLTAILSELRLTEFDLGSLFAEAQYLVDGWFTEPSP